MFKPTMIAALLALSLGAHATSKPDDGCKGNCPTTEGVTVVNNVYITNTNTNQVQVDQHSVQIADVGVKVEQTQAQLQQTNTNVAAFAASAAQATADVDNKVTNVNVALASAVQKQTSVNLNQQKQNQQQNQLNVQQQAVNVQQSAVNQQTQGQIQSTNNKVVQVAEIANTATVTNDRQDNTLALQSRAINAQADRQQALENYTADLDVRLGGRISSAQSTANRALQQSKEAKEIGVTAAALAMQQFDTDYSAGFQTAISVANSGGVSALALGAGGALSEDWFINVGISKAGDSTTVGASVTTRW